MHLIETLEEDSLGAIGMFGQVVRNKPDLSPALPSCAVLKLHSTARQYQRSHFTDDGSQYDQIMVAAAIVASGPRLRGGNEAELPSKLRILGNIAHDRLDQENFVAPCGEVLPKDESVACALARVVKDQTGLRVVRVVGGLPDSTYEAEELKVLSTGHALSIRRSVRQLNFVVEVEEEVFHADTSMLSEFSLVPEDEVEAMRVVGSTKQFLNDVIGWLRNNQDNCLKTRNC